MCLKNPDCNNAVILIIDTNFLQQLWLTVAQYLSKPKKSLIEQDEDFKTKFKELLEILASCSNEVGDGKKLHTSQKVFSNEIDLVSATALRDSTEEIVALCGDNDFSSEMNDILSNNLQIWPLNEEKIDGLMSQIPRDSGLSRSDTSLVVLALELGRDVRTAIVSDDEGLFNFAYDWLKQKEFVRLGAQEFATNNVHIFKSLDVLRELHGCCPIETLFYQQGILEYAKRTMSRIGQGLPSAKFSVKTKLVGSLLEEFEREKRTKEKAVRQQAITESLAQEFGVEP